MSSPNMNNLIIAGSICTYVSVILHGFDTRFVSPDTFVTLCYVSELFLFGENGSPRLETSILKKIVGAGSTRSVE